MTIAVVDDHVDERRHYIVAIRSWLFATRLITEREEELQKQNSHSVRAHDHRLKR
jgi:hypothetical protein